VHPIHILSFSTLSNPFWRSAFQSSVSVISDYQLSG
jgi:hypothetical protein